MPRAIKVDPPGSPAAFRAVCSDALGFLKVVEAVGPGTAPQVVARWGEPNTSKAVLRISVAGQELAVARKNGWVNVLDAASGALRAQLPVPVSLAGQPAAGHGEEEDAACGLHLFRHDASGARNVLTCTGGGVLAVQGIPDDGGPIDVSLSVSTWRVCETGGVLCLKVDDAEKHAVCGGKGSDPLLWDLETGSSVWAAKLPKRDKLCLVSRPHVTAVTFLRGGDSQKIVAGTGYHQVRLYDVKAQRRPVLIFDHGESPITCMVDEGDGFKVYLGTGSGDISSFDMRTGQCFGSFKGGCAGSVRAVVRHPTLPLLASCGLDRFLRIHDVKTRQLLSKVFLKQQLLALSFSSLPELEISHPVDTVVPISQLKGTEGGAGDLEAAIEGQTKRRERMVKKAGVAHREETTETQGQVTRKERNVKKGGVADRKEAIGTERPGKRKKCDIARKYPDE